MSRSSLSQNRRPDETTPANSPGLLLETGRPDDDRRELDPRHERYGLFFTAWRSQDGWSLEEHGRFWQASLDLWPRRGKPGRRVELAHAYRVATDRGLSHEEAAEVVGLKPDTLRRKEVPGLAGELSGGAVTDYVLPRIYTHDEPIPDPMAFPNVVVGASAPGQFDIVEPADLRTVEIQRRLDALLD
jgi:hypothetical protein